jgi:hypothetical protein
MGGMKNEYKILVGRPEGKRLLGRPGHRWECLKWISEEYGVWMWTGFIWLRIRSSGFLL